MRKTGLLASSDSLAGIQRAIMRYFCATPVELKEVQEHEWDVFRASDGRHLSAVQVRLVKGRFRFQLRPQTADQT